LGALALLSAFALTSSAQNGNGVLQPHLRADALIAREGAIHLAAGVSVRGSRYLRVDLTVGAGTGSRPGGGGGQQGEGRGDLVARFVLDPEFSRRWSMYGGGGVSVRVFGGESRELLLVALGVEGPRWGGVVPFAEVGLAGGARIGAGIRRALAGRR
jgi:hypothetical protein